jgi:DNA-binding PadR family transcriptional regulator
MARKKAEIDELLQNWEEVYKKGLLTFWLLLFLHERPAYAYEASGALVQLSRGTISADENSMYRALNRFESLGIVTSESRQSNVGPARRYYSLTASGVALLAKFIQRNILLFQVPSIAERLQSVLREVNLPQKEPEV